MAENTEQNYYVPGTKRLTTLKHLPFRLGIFITLLGLLIASDVRGDQIDWPTVSLNQVVTNNFFFPTAITHAGDGSQRLFICERAGRIRIIQNSNVLAQPFLDITDRVLPAYIEQGLLGLAFPPGYSTNSHFYVDYTRKPDGAVVISRFQLTADPNVADTNSEQVVLVIPKPFSNHNGGQIAFGPDGYLYIGVGDGGSEGDPQLNGQKTSTLLGKLLRIDVESGVTTYSVPTNNPFVGNTNYAPEIWALGLRNPWRFSFDRLTGDLFIADVGQGRYEEINTQPASSIGGENYGWRIMEGPTNNTVPAGFTNFSALKKPIFWYDHVSLSQDGAASVTGGYVYRGPNEPRMNGVYFFADFVATWMWAGKYDGTNWQQVFLNPSSSSISNTSISTFGEDEQGRLYVGAYSQGKIYQVVDSQQVWTPVFKPSKGVINSNLVIVSCATANAEIHYTTNGIDPTMSDPIIASDSPIVVTTGVTNKVRAFRIGLAPSGTASAVFTNKVATPQFNPSAGPISNGTTVAISTLTPGASIFYTTNGSTPSTNSLLYSAPFLLNGGTTLKALGAASGYITSAVQSVTYNLARVATPTFSPTAGPITNGTVVTLSSATPGAAIYYTLDGSTPTTNSTLYTGPLTLSGPVSLSALAHRPDLLSGFVTSVFYGRISYEPSIVTTIARGLSSPHGLCLDPAGNFFVANSGVGTIRKITPTGEASTVGLVNASTGIAIDPSGNLYVGEGECSVVWKIDTNGVKMLFATFRDCTQVSQLGQLETDPAGNLYVGSVGSVEKILPDGTRTSYPCPGSHLGVGIDAATNIFAVTLGDVWQVSPTGTTIHIAGAGQGFSDGPGTNASFQNAQDAVVDANNNIFVSDLAAVRKIRPDGWVSTFAGGGVSGYKDGKGSTAQFNNPAGMCVDTNGNVYVADSGNNCIRKISPDTANIGIADDWQKTYFGTVGIDPNADPDHDGLSNFSEFWAGTDPLNSNSSLAIAVTPTLQSGQLQIRWQSVAGKTYTVQYSTDLIAWNNLGNPVSGNGNALSVFDNNPIGPTGRRFYRLVLTDF